ncbi:MAG: DUF2723 domain-containing protein [Ardenticatenaceae bacterium]|nr:DUF2723 domain-containing protein [Anaerolineales bacterium]MCB8940324.1 DUF2723 domain-containing protein [Ardenticatenaceae bacterium]MCB8973340.1 DUF2723 domain-containing protein [Ardenticatenaceae bacterium]
MTTSRIVYEGLFPRWLWLGRPFLTLTVTAILTFATWLVWQRAWPKGVPPIVLSPLLLNLIYLADPLVDLGRSRLIFGASLWLALLLWSNRRWRGRADVWRWLGPLLVVLALLPVYLSTMSRTVGQADTFEFQVVAPQLGIAHPTGYPLYLLLGKLFSLLPFGSVAWRINVGTAVLATIALIFFFKILWELWGGVATAASAPLSASVLGAVVMGFTSTLFSQAIAAEVYALHALVVCVAVWIMLRIGDWRLETGDSSLRSPRSLRLNLLLLAFVIGLGLTNHLTTLFLLPPAGIAVLSVMWRGKSGTQSYTEEAQSSTEINYQLPITNYRSLYAKRSRSDITDYRLLIKIVFAFAAPLLLYAYLPLRWQAVNGEPMGLSRLVDWVIGGRFQDALQWGAWLNDLGRYGIVARLFVENWGEFNLALALVGFGYLIWRNWRVAAVLGVTWLGFTFYCLNYYVPDLAVFLIPAQLVVGLLWASGVTAVLHLITQRLNHENRPLIPLVQPVVLLLLLLPTLMLVVNNRARLNSSLADGRTAWGQGVLQQPLAENAAILADSDKFPPLYYLQQAEGIRPDLDIMVLPDEAAYRAELDARLAAGQTVYLARFLPGLAGIYHLRAVGALTEVSTEPLLERPSTTNPTDFAFGPMRLVGVGIEPEDPSDPTASAATLVWQTDAPIGETLHIFVRWAGQNDEGAPDVATGQHAVHNNYPTVAWRPGELVVDVHSWPRPLLPAAQTLNLQVAVAPPFTPLTVLNWQTVASHEFAPTPARQLAQPLRAQVGAALLNGVAFPAQIRPETALPILLAGEGSAAGLNFVLRQNGLPLPQPGLAPETAVPPNQSFTNQIAIETPTENGRYQILAEHESGQAQCGWMRPVTNFCVVGEVLVSGVPLPEGATNFEDKIALLGVDIPDRTLPPGGLLDITLTWQALAPLAEDYTVFVQVLDANDQIVGQIDSWPVQGTYPTSQWSPGETVLDRHQVQLAGELPAGAYRVAVGFYLLQTLRRLSVLDGTGTAVDDKLLLTGFTAK